MQAVCPNLKVEFYNSLPLPLFNSPFSLLLLLVIQINHFNLGLHGKLPNHSHIDHPLMTPNQRTHRSHNVYQPHCLYCPQFNYLIFSIFFTIVTTSGFSQKTLFVILSPKLCLYPQGNKERSHQKCTVGKCGNT